MDWIIGKPLRITAWVLFPPLGLLLSWRHGKRRNRRATERRHRELVRAVSAPRPTLARHAVADR